MTSGGFPPRSSVDRLQEAGGWASPILPLRYANKAKIAHEGVNLGERCNTSRKRAFAHFCIAKRPFWYLTLVSYKSRAPNGKLTRK